MTTERRLTRRGDSRMFGILARLPFIASRFNDGSIEGNKIIRTYNPKGQFTDRTVDQIIASKQNQWKGWLCSAGVNHIYIDFDGDVYRGNCRIGGTQGNIFSGFELSREWIECTADFCGCGSDIMTAKVKTAKDASLLLNLNEIPHGGKSKRIANVSEVVAVETAFRPPPHIRVQWDLGRRCNYSCSYCWPTAHSSTEPLKSHDSLIQAAADLLEKLPRNKKVLFQFGGGEPTLYPRYLEFLQFLKGKGHSAVTTTNGSRHYSFFKDLIQLSSINLSVHFEFADLAKLKTNIQSVLKVLNEKQCNESLEIKLMTPPGVVRKSKSFVDELKTLSGFNEKVTWSYVPIRTGGYASTESASKVVDYSESEIQVIQDRL